MSNEALCPVSRDALPTGIIEEMKAHGFQGRWAVDLGLAAVWEIGCHTVLVRGADSAPSPNPY